MHPTANKPLQRRIEWSQSYLALVGTYDGHDERQLTFFKLIQTVTHCIDLAKHSLAREIGWGGRIRTCECRYQKPVPYHLATPQQAPAHLRGSGAYTEPFETWKLLISSIIWAFPSRKGIFTCAIQPGSKRRPSRELLGEFQQVELILRFECRFPDRVLFEVVMPAKADGPSVGWLHSETAIGAATNVGALDRKSLTAADRATMAPDPGAVRCAGARGLLGTLLR